MVSVLSSNDDGFPLVPPVGHPPSACPSPLLRLLLQRGEIQRRQSVRSQVRPSSVGDRTFQAVGRE